MPDFHTIVLPVRPQPDTIVAIFILKRFGERQFPGIEKAQYEFWPTLPDNKNSESLLGEGFLLIDLGGGIFDHHNKNEKTTASQLAADYLGQADDLSLAKLLEYARRDDFFGKGTISTDAIDRAFGLSGLVAALNKSFPRHPARVIDLILPLLAAHHAEEKRRLEEFPAAVQEKKEQGKVIEFSVKQREKKLKVIMIESDNVGLPGYLRSQIGGRYDVVVQKNRAGYVNILTRPTKRVDLRSLVALIRLRESDQNSVKLADDLRLLMTPGRIPEVNNWYYDTATNSMLNGGSSPSPEIAPTRIPWLELKKITELGLSEKLLNP